MVRLLYTLCFQLFCYQIDTFLCASWVWVTQVIAFKFGQDCLSDTRCESCKLLKIIMFCIWSSLFRQKMPAQTLLVHTSARCQIFWRRDGLKQLRLRLVRGCLWLFMSSVSSLSLAYSPQPLKEMTVSQSWFVQDFKGRSQRTCFLYFV